MVHILLLILKIIGITLAVILGLILLVLLVVLFVPVRYYASGTKTDTQLEAKGKVTWLLHLVSVTVGYRDNEMYHVIKIFGIDVEKALAFFSKRKAKKEAKQAAKQSNTTANTSEVALEIPKLPEESSSTQPLQIEGTEHIENVPADTTIQQTIDNPTSEEEIVDIPADDSTVVLLEDSGAIEEDVVEKESIFSKIIRIIKNIFHKIISVIKTICSIPGKIIAAIKKIGLTIQSIYAKISYWKAFIQDTRTKDAIGAVMGGLKKSLRHIAPRKIKGDVTFGFDDPYQTGQVLAGLCTIYPVYGKQIQINPAFDRQILEGHLELKGRMFVCVFLKVAWTLFRDKNIRYVIKTFQNKEEA